MPSKKQNLLRSTLYEYMLDELRNGHLVSGKSISLNKLASQLNVSKTPLRDALLELQAEGFLTLYPQRGVYINELSSHDKEEIYEVCRLLDAQVVRNVCHKITTKELDTLKKINSMMSPDNPDLTSHIYNELNMEFHNIYLDLDKNEFLKKIIKTSRKRLFQFAQRDWGYEFSKINYLEHNEIIRLFEEKNCEAVAQYIKNTHWSFNW